MSAGALVGLNKFSSRSGSGSNPYDEVPQKGWQKAGIQELRNLLNRNPDVPVQQIAPMSAAERAGQSSLADILSGAAFQDPTTSPLYAAFRNESYGQEARGVDLLRRRGQLAGAGQSSGSFGAEGAYRGDMANDRLGFLAQLYEKERDRDNPYTRAAAAQQFGALPRQIEQAGMDAQQAASMLNDLVIPYQWKSSIAQELMKHQPTLYHQPQTASSGGAGLLGGILGLASMFIPGAGAGAGAAGGVTTGTQYLSPGISSGGWV